MNTDNNRNICDYESYGKNSAIPGIWILSGTEKTLHFEFCANNYRPVVHHEIEKETIL